MEAIARVDVPKTFAGIMAQRRRWINGSWFALMHTFREFVNIKDTTHGCCRKFNLVILMLYHSIGALVAYLSPAIFYVYLHIILDVSYDDLYYEELDIIIKMLYGIVTILNLVTAFGNKPGSNLKVYVFSAVVLGIIEFFALLLSLI